MHTSTELCRIRARKLQFAFTLGALFFLGCLPNRNAAAQTASDDHQRRANAEALFDEAKTLMKMNRHAEACPKLAESQALDPAVGTLLNLADCLERLGQTASAWAEFRAAAAAAHAKGQTHREQVARERATRLEKRLVHLTIVVPNDSDDLEIRKNGQIVGRSSWGLSLPVDPGRMVIEASARDKQTFRTEIVVPAKPGTQLTTVIPPLDPLNSRIGHGQRIAGIAIGSVGAVSIVIGTILGTKAMQFNSASAEHCQGNLCDATGVALRSDARSAGNAATAAIILGAVAGAGGIITYALAPKKTSVKVGFGATASSAGVFVGGAF